MTDVKELKILAVDTSTQACSVSLKIGENSITEFALTPQTHANHVLSMVDKALSKAKLSGVDVDYLALSEGPGAFTGVRIAAGVVQGLAFGWNKPVISISTLEALAWPMAKEVSSSPVVACLDARMNELYIQVCLVQNGVLTSEPPQLLSEPDAITLCKKKGIDMATGDIEKEFPELVSIFNQWQGGVPSAENVAIIASQRIAQAKSVLEVVPTPVYLRNNIAKKSK
ncbi:tRNA (adenosine(37)-N6)-threonylcarbamoyltransferase complex dimerization subunit type 1 TsaB [Hydrogenovibrio kuenenii]|uniref:tRNA (adenosine(37)-N6)-threonylcarbamoyltransferase complex dimerization subunit type 1 TsaB n=1 Tax=Hydrogenovibrio kuenenii TaxID=63658 RepID=UPI000463304B|nr:tRNA (adenosine(37)-N6)-threonylcarbamoyltransferase complex dimerization subunit type 1 TsaB [Hydrogenovibrio kuenenii]